MSDEDFLDFLASPAEEDEAKEVASWVRFMRCPKCEAEYPDFHSIAGEVHTLCDHCGWSSEVDG